MKNYFLPLIIALVFLFHMPANCQSFNWEWAKYINENEDDAGKDVTVDKDGNIIVVGSFVQASLKFDNIQINNKLKYASALFCVKYNSNGNVIWAKSLNAVKSDIDIKCVSSDNEGNIFIGGHFTYNDTIYAGPSKLYSTEIGYQHFFVVKMDSSGNILWGLNSSGRETEMIFDLHCDSQGNFYLGGGFYGGHMEILGHLVQEQQYWSFSAFLAKFDSNGNIIWIKNTEAGNSAICHSITTDQNNNVLVTGYTHSPITFGTITLGATGDGTFLYKFDSKGNVLWGKEGNGLAQIRTGNKCVYTDNENNIYLISSMEGYYTIDGFTASAMDNDFAYVVKFNKDGVVQWVTALDTDYSNSNDDNYHTGGKIVIDSFGNLYASPQSSNPLIYIIDKNNGSIKWTAVATGSSYANKIVSMAASSQGEVYATGWYEAANLNFSDKFTIPNSYATPDFGGNNMFLAKLSMKTLTVSKNTLTINAPANSSATFDISSNTTWTAGCDQPWLTLSSTSGTNNGTITVTATANTTSSLRNAMVTVSGNGVESKTITITQLTAESTPELTVSPTTLNVNAAANSTSMFTITSNVSWTTSCDQPWLTLSSTSGSNTGAITVTAAANTTSNPRIATVTVSGSGVTSKTVAITQAAGVTPSLTVSPTTLNLNAAANSTSTFTITSNISWTTSCDQPWLTLSSTSGSNTGTITVTATANATLSPRTATVTVSGSGVTSKTVVITQAASPSLAISPTILNLNAAANSTSTFTVTSNVNWTVSCDQPWLTLSSTSGVNTGTITVTAGANTATTPRTAAITVSGSGVTSKTVAITQAASPLNCQSFNWEWAKYINENDEDAGKDVTVDKDGNIIVVGSFAQASLKFDNIQINNKSRYTFGLFCVKYNSNGNVIWAKSLNTVRFDIEVTCVSSDKMGNIFIGGHFTYKDTIYAGPSKLYSSEIGYQHIFVVKMDSSGNILWGINSSGSLFQRINDIHCDLQGSFYICGMFDGDYIEFDGIKTYRKSDYGDSFFAKFDSSGKNIWVNNAANGCCFGITTDMNNNILVSGQTFYPITFGNITLGTLSDDGTFLYKFDSNGNALWGKEGYGLEHYHVSHKCVYSDKESNIYLISTMAGYYTIDGFTASATDNDFAYIVKFNKDGVTQWITPLDTDYSKVDGDNYYSGGEISMDSFGNLYVAPESSNPLIYGIDKNDGSIKWAAIATGSSNTNKIASIAASGQGEVYATGWYEAANLNFSDKFTIPNSYATSDFGGNNMFFAKLSIKNLTVSKNTLIIDDQANSSATFDISSNVTWTVSCDQTWLTLSSTSGSNNSTITVTASANTASNPRTAMVTVSGVGVTSKTVTITQSAAVIVPSLAVSPATLSINAAANSTSTFTITSNINWTASSNQSWLTLSSSSGSNNGTITVTATANTTSNPRVATVTVSGVGVTSKTVTITQSAAVIVPSLAVSPATLSINAAANSTSTFTVTSNINWTASSNQSWLTLSSSSGSNNGTITVTAAANTTSNPRIATVTVSGVGVTSKTVTITQAAAPSLAVSPATLSINAAANSTSTFTVTSNINWTASSNQSWLTLSSSSGSNNGTITVTATANTTSNPRVATVTVSGVGVTSKTVTITQAAAVVVPSLAVSPATLNINAAANSTSTFTITSNINWTASSNQSWLTLSSSSGSNNTTITVTATANTTSNPRIATVTVSGVGVTGKTVTITQAAAPSLAVSPATLSINAAANSTSTFTITSNINWTASSNKNWLTLSTISGSNNATITVTAAANTVTSLRTAVITILGTGVTSKTITVTQNAALPALSVSPTVLSIGAAANSTSSFTITANQSWTASSNQSWLKLNGTAGLYNATIIVTAKANPVNTPREALVTVSSSGLESKVISITQEAGTVVTGDAEVDDDNIKIYPNPFTDKVRVTLSNATPNAFIGIYNLNGIQLYNYEVKDGFVEFDMTKYPSGLYFVRIKTQNEVVAKRVVKY